MSFFHNPCREGPSPCKTPAPLSAPPYSAPDPRTTPSSFNPLGPTSPPTQARLTCGWTPVRVSGCHSSSAAAKGGHSGSTSGPLTLGWFPGGFGQRPSSSGRCRDDADALRDLRERTRPNSPGTWWGGEPGGRGLRSEAVGDLGGAEPCMGPEGGQREGLMGCEASRFPTGD